jgi:hypothetical protein
MTAAADMGSPVVEVRFILWLEGRPWRTMAACGRPAPRRSPLHLVDAVVLTDDLHAEQSDHRDGGREATQRTVHPPPPTT